MKKFLKIFICLLVLSGFINNTEAKNMDTLTIKEKNIVVISALTAANNQAKLEEAVNKSLDDGMTLNELKEILVQLYAYCGFPRSLNAINTAIKVSDERKANGITDSDRIYEGECIILPEF